MLIMQNRIIFGLMALLSLPPIISGCSHRATKMSGAEAHQFYDQYINEKLIPYYSNSKSRTNNVIINPPTPAYKATWDALNEAERGKTTKELLAFAMEGTDPHERSAKLIWLRWKILDGNADSRYSYAYAYLLSITKDAGSATTMMQSAATFLFQARIALAIDGAHCLDQASPPNARRSMEQVPQMSPIINYIANGPKSEVADSLVNAIAIEKFRPNRPPSNWLCNLGAASALKSINDPSAIKISNGNIYIDASNTSPEFASSDTWLQRKKSIISEQYKALETYTR